MKIELFFFMLFWMVCSGCVYEPLTAYYPVNASKKYQIKGRYCWGAAGPPDAVYYFNKNLRIRFMIVKNINDEFLEFYIRLKKENFNKLTFDPFSVQVKVSGKFETFNLITLKYKNFHQMPEVYTIKNKNNIIDKELYSEIKRKFAIYLTTQEFIKSEHIIVKPPDLIIDDKRYIFDEIEFKLDTKMYFDVFGNC